MRSSSFRILPLPTFCRDFTVRSFWHGHIVGAETAITGQGCLRQERNASLYHSVSLCCRCDFAREVLNRGWKQDLPSISLWLFCIGLGFGVWDTTTYEIRHFSLTLSVLDFFRVRS